MNQNPFAVFGKHLVSLLCIDEDQAKIISMASNPPAGYILSGVVVSVDDQWFIMTAQHVVNRIRKRLTLARRKITKCRIFDCFSSDAPHIEPIPLAYEDSVKILFGDEKDHFDVAALPLSENTRDLLRANHIVPLDRNAWSHRLPECDEYWLCGVPECAIEAAQLNSDGSILPAAFVASAMRLKRLHERPTEFPDHPTPYFYGQLVGDWVDQHGNPIPNDIKGMSGGPIFGIRYQDQRAERYCLVAIQSGWLASSGRIAAACTAIACESLSYTIQELRKGRNIAMPA